MAVFALDLQGYNYLSDPAGLDNKKQYRIIPGKIKRM